MKVGMVKHKPDGKVFWFEIPEHLVGKLQPGFRVACNTALPIILPASVSKKNVGGGAINAMLVL